MSTDMVHTGGSIATAIAPNIGPLTQLAQFFAGFDVLPKRMTVTDAMIAAAAGARFNMDPMTSLLAFHVVEGSPTMDATAMAAIIIAHPLCEDWRWVKTDDRIAALRVQRRGKEPEIYNYTIEQAKNAGLAGKKNWQKHTAAMLRARCITVAGRAAFPDIIFGLYSREEMADSDLVEPRDIIDAEFVDESPRRPTNADLQNARILAAAAGVSPEAALRQVMDGESADAATRHAAQPGRQRPSNPPHPSEGEGVAGGEAIDPEAQRQADLDAEFGQFMRWADEAGIAAAYLIAGQVIGRPDGMVFMRAWNSPTKWREESKRLAAIFADSGMEDAQALANLAHELMTEAGGGAEAFAALQASINNAAGKVVGDGKMTDTDAANRGAAACIIAERCIRKPRETFAALGMEVSK